MTNKKIEIVKLTDETKVIRCIIEDCQLSYCGICHWCLTDDTNWRSPACPHSFEQLAVTTNELWLADRHILSAAY
jgi:hypothetical protein